MNLKRFFAVFKARNLEFWRDKSSLAWNFIFPVLLVAGFAVVFGNGNKAEYKIGVLQATATIDHSTHPFLQTRYLEFVPYVAKEQALKKLQHHQLRHRAVRIEGRDLIGGRGQTAVELPGELVAADLARLPDDLGGVLVLVR